MDFTIKAYKDLLFSIIHSDYVIQTFEEFMLNPMKRVVVLRHDIDERPANALKMAIVEHELGIKATYYFRIVKISNDPFVIRKIADLGHEIGYHYEDYATFHGNLLKAIHSFKTNLSYFREYYPVKTVCMHGSSMSEFDNRVLWEHYSLEEFGLIGEPYLSIDYTKVQYLTDTGRCWDGGKYSVRDFVNQNYKLSFHTSNDIINGINANIFPNRVILQSHTLWTDSLIEWLWLEVREKTRNNFKMWIVNQPFLKSISYKLIQLYSNK
jgi:hypothetical protein